MHSDELVHSEIAVFRSADNDKEIVLYILGHFIPLHEDEWELLAQVIDRERSR